MKKLIALIIALITAALLLASCGSEPETTTTTEATTAEEIEIIQPGVVLYASSLAHPAIEMKSRVLLTADFGQLWYYSKADGESYPFCFNPLCPHSYQANCPSILFNASLISASQAYYNESNNRVYIVRGQQIYSLSFDASDLKLECSLGEKGKIETDMTYRTQNNYVVNLTAYENYLFFMYNNDETGHSQIMRYDMNKRILEEMTSATDDWALSFVLASGYIYVRVLEDNLVKYYTTDYDFQEKHYVYDCPDIDASELASPKMYVYDGEYFYINEGGVFYMFNPLTEETKVIPTGSDFEGGTIWAVYDGYVYYQPYINNGYRIGNSTSVYAHRNIRRVSMIGETEDVFDMPGSMMQGINFVSDGVIVFFMSIDMFDENDNMTGQANMCSVHFDVAKDGRFINPKPIGRASNNEQLVEYLANYDLSNGKPGGSTTTESTTATATTATKATTVTEATTEATTAASTAIEIDVKTVSDHLAALSSLPKIGDHTSTRDIPFEKFFKSNLSVNDEAHAKHWYADNYRILYDLSDLQNITILQEYYRKDYFNGKKKSSDEHICFFTVAGTKGDISRSFSMHGYPATDYYTYRYVYGEDSVDDTVYTLTQLAGIPKTLCYGYFRYEIGDTYLVFISDKNMNTQYKDTTEYPLQVHLKVEEIDGVLWVYTDNYWSFEGMKCAVKITDEYENLMYKPGKDDDVIAYMEANGIENPTYDYKCELGAFIEEMMEK